MWKYLNPYLGIKEYLKLLGSRPIRPFSFLKGTKKWAAAPLLTMLIGAFLIIGSFFKSADFEFGIRILSGGIIAMVIGYCAAVLMVKASEK